MFVGLCLMALLLVIAFSVNTGVVVNDRLRMQETADLATYAVAYSEAASLNDITKKNKGIAEAVSNCRTTMEHGGAPWATPCNCGPTDPFAEVALQVCRVEITEAILQFTSTASYSNSVEPALKAGKATAKANFSGTERNTTFFDDIFGSPTAMWTYSTMWSTPLGAAGIIPSIASFEQVTDTAFNYQYMQFCASHCAPSGISLSATTTMPSWFYKQNRDPEVWVAGRVAGTPEKRFLDTDYKAGGHDGGYFGGSSTGGDDMLVSYAVAKPYDGSVGPSELGGIQQNGNMIGGAGVYIARGVTYPKLSMYDEYRARMAGIQDGLEGGLPPTTLIAIDGAELGKSWDTSKFEH
ncbi:hypothetical protein LBMAG42_33250 [Deltaproteobacteria bacterium]|nr:hypothetical protein LBMAG42_33250 [Deltaproteobacteria bacterium]